MNENLSGHQKEILKSALKPGSTILFNIKGMIEVLHEEGPFTFIEMGYEDIQYLQKKGLIAPKNATGEKSVLQGEEYLLTDLGKQLAKKL